MLMNFKNFTPCSFPQLLTFLNIPIFLDAKYGDKNVGGLDESQ